MRSEGRHVPIGLGPWPMSNRIQGDRGPWRGDTMTIEPRMSRFSRITMNIWTGLSLITLFGLLISVPGPGMFADMVSVLWWRTSSGIFSVSFASCAAIAALGSIGFITRGVWRARFTAASALVFTASSYIVGVSSTDSTAMLFELAILNAPAILAVIWLLAPPQPKTPGHCSGCGYRLKGIRSECCPECGAPIVASSKPF